MGSVSDEEQQRYIRSCKMVITVAQPIFREAVNKAVDDIVPKITFQQLLVNNKAHLKTLYTGKKKIITDTQWNMLFPPGGSAAAATDEFDITTLMVLVRNLKVSSTNIFKTPSTGWDKISPPTDITIEDDLKRIKSNRNTLAHQTAILEADYIKILEEMMEVTCRLQKVLIPTESYVLKLCQVYGAQLNNTDYDQNFTDILHRQWKEEQELKTLVAAVHDVKESINKVMESVTRGIINPSSPAVEQYHLAQKSEVPEKVQGISVQCTGISSALVSWQHNKENTDKYLMIYRVKSEKSTGKRAEIVELDVSELDHGTTAMDKSITQLQPGTTYDVAVHAQNDDGQSEKEYCTVTTKPAPPTEIQSLSPAATELQLGWPKPQGQADGYNIAVFHMTLKNEKHKENSYLERQLTVSDLIPGNEYIVKVQSIVHSSETTNKVLESDWIERTFYTVPGKVENMKLQSKTACSLHVSWGNPVTGQIGHGHASYIIDICKLGQKKKLRTDYVYGNEYVFDDLEAGVKYCVRVVVSYKGLKSVPVTDEFMTDKF